MKPGTGVVYWIAQLLGASAAGVVIEAVTTFFLVYWIGPRLGGAAAALVQHSFLMERKLARPR